MALSHHSDPVHRLSLMLAAVLGLMAFCMPGTLSASFGTAAERTPGDRRTDGVNSANRMLLEIEINRPEDTRRGHRRPYVAAWLTDKDGFPVRTILLWVQNASPGPRWIPDLRQWYRDDRLRRLVDDKDLVDAVSGPTRNIGQYRIAWDGTDDSGKQLPQGIYTLHIEAAREHGTYQLIHEKLHLSENDFSKELKGNAEIKSVKLTYTAPETGK